MHAPSASPARPRLLLFEQRMIGDAVMALPFIRSAGQHFDVFVTCAEHSAAIFRMAMPEERILPWTPPWIMDPGRRDWRNAHLSSYLQRLRSVRAEAAACGWADARSHLLMALSGARVRAGFPMSERNLYASHLPWRKKQIKFGALLTTLGSLLTLRPLLTTRVARTAYYQHHVEDFRDLAAALQLPWDEHQPWLPGPLPGRPPGPPTWLIHPGARFAGRRWPLPHFVRLIREVLLPRGLRVLFIQAPELPPAAGLPPEVELLSPASLPAFVDLCRGADFLLCNDTGVSHIGAALGKTVVSIFSNQEPRWFAPRGSETQAIFRNVCPHRPCLDHCVMPSYICLEAVTYETVRDHVLTLVPSL